MTDDNTDAQLPARFALADNSVVRVIRSETGIKLIIEQEAIDSGAVFIARKLDASGYALG